MNKRRFATPPKTADLRPKAPEALKAEVFALREKITEKVAQNPSKAAKVLAFWLQEPVSGTPSLPKKKSA